LSLHANLWEETAAPAPAVPVLEGAAAADVLVIGTGYLGLSAALHLAEAGVRVVAIDAAATAGRSYRDSNTTRTNLKPYSAARPASGCGALPAARRNWCST